MKLSYGVLLSALALASAMPNIVVEPKLERELTIAKDLSIIPSDDVHIKVRQNAGEVVSCYNIGTSIDRASILYAIDNFCSRIIGTTLERATITLTYTFGSVTVKLWGQAINDCRWTVDSNCNRLLRYPVDNCDTDTVTAKRGGYVTDRCGIWGVDPGSNGSDY